MVDEYIILVAEDSGEETDGEGKKGHPLRDAKKLIGRLREVKISPDLLERNMTAFLHVVSRLFKKVKQEIGSESNLELDEVELVVEIGTEGEVKLIAGGKAAGKGAITLKFKRSK